jgi:hypothetical protein
MPELSINGRRVNVPEGTTVAVALITAGESAFRRSVSGERRGPLCGMGICFECRVTIDGAPHSRSCQILCSQGMNVTTP